MWIDDKDVPESLAIIGRMVSVCGRLGGPVSRHLAALYEAGDVLAILDYRFDYRSFSAAELDDLVYARQIQAFFSKSSELSAWYGLTFDPKLTAARKFLQAELLCLETNRRLRADAQNPMNMDPDVATVMFMVQRKIASVLGDVPDLEGLNPQFGPGANTNVKSSAAFPRGKLSAGLECSHELAPTVGDFLSEVPLWAALHCTKDLEDSFICNVSVAPGKVVFVPKNAKTDRTIIVEPLLNSFFQKGFGSFIRDRLRASGIDLRDQTINQSLALEGSVDDSLSTIDLSSASDCLSRELVWNLLPYDWANTLSHLRTGTVVCPDVFLSLDELKSLAGFDGSHLRLEKFSSMGNGYTFELESLIFYGIAHSVCRFLDLSVDKVSVYGDDIIVPRPAYELLSKVLSYCGFIVNHDKSFVEGPFRESCGADYFFGFDIRPFYLKTRISDRILYSMHNWMVRHGEVELAAVIPPFCNQSELLYGPDGFGDGHLLGSYTLRRNRSMSRSGWEGGYFDTYALRPRRIKAPLPGDAVLPAYSVYTRSGQSSQTDPDVVRGSKGYAKMSVYTLARGVFR